MALASVLNRLGDAKKIRGAERSEIRLCMESTRYAGLRKVRCVEACVDLLRRGPCLSFEVQVVRLYTSAALCISCLAAFCGWA